MEQFTEIFDGIFLLKTPFPPAWSGCILVKGKEPCLIDSGANEDVVVNTILPALKQEGFDLEDISWLLHTHSHGDHIGGHGKIKELFPQIKVATMRQCQAALKDPVAVAKRIRTRYPQFSPEPQCYLIGTNTDRLLDDGEQLTDRLCAIHCPGHDSDSVSWFDLNTRTLICGDSLQGNGTVNQGIAFYQSLSDYRRTLERLLALDAENILAGHDYAGFGYIVKGRNKTKQALQFCMDMTYEYQEVVDRMLASGISSTSAIAESLIREKGCSKPSLLFLAMHTVNTHIEHNTQRKGNKQ